MLSGSHNNDLDSASTKLRLRAGHISLQVMEGTVWVCQYSSPTWRNIMQVHHARNSNYKRSEPSKPHTM